MSKMIEWSGAPCCRTVSAADCMCGQQERYIRAVAAGDMTLSPAQREYCLSEIGRVEGYSRADYESGDDRTIASSTLCAWLDYCRDKGLIA